MKIVTWNCQGAFRNKLTAIAQYQPDIAVIQECESLERIHFPEDQPQPKAQLWFGDYPPKGLGIFSFTDTKLEASDNYDRSIEYCIPIKVHGAFSFNLIAVWTMKTNNNYIGRVDTAIQKYQEFIDQRSTFLIGDFNSNETGDNNWKTGLYSKVVADLADKQIVSAYHEYFKEQHGQESLNTFYWYRHPDKGCHIDYCFAPQTWVDRIKTLTVGSYGDWSSLSDHCPIFIEFE